MQDEPTTPAPDQMADIDAALSHLGFDSVADLHYWASDDNELNRFDALVQLLAAHRQTALTAARAQVEALGNRPVVAWMYQGPAMLEDETIIQDRKCFPLRQVYMPSGWIETPLYAHPPTTNPVAVSETPVGDHQMVEAVAMALCEVDGDRWNAKDFTETLSGNDPDDVRAHYFDLAQAALTAARAQVEGENVAWLQGAFQQQRKHPEDQAFARHIAAALAAGEHRKDG